MSTQTVFAPDAVALVIGASGGVGRAVATMLDGDPRFGAVHRLSRRSGEIDLTDEASIAAAAARFDRIDFLFCAAGVLHDDAMKPEKSWAAIDPDAMLRAYAVNAVGPALIAKHFLAKTPKASRSVFAALSARVGSISDNQLGGWTSYRASKAALNQVVRTLSVELARKRPEGLIVGLHPGTVDTALSKPFQRNARLFTPEESAAHLLKTLDGLTPQDSGRCFAWDGAEIAP